MKTQESRLGVAEIDGWHAGKERRGIVCTGKVRAIAD